MRDAVGEEYKHFSMDLEFLLRRTPVWREIAQGILFQPGDIVEHGEAAEEAAGGDDGDGGRRHADDGTGSLGIGSLRRWPCDEQPSPSLPRADQRRQLEAARRRGARAPRRGARRPQARRLPRAARAGSTRPPTSAGSPTSRPRPCEGVTALQRRVLPLVELRADFAISRAELRDDDRGADDADLEPLDDAAHRMAVAENKSVFHGWPEAAIVGIAEASPHQGLTLGEEADSYPRPVASAVEQLLQAGIGGPYALALGSDEFKRVSETAEHGGYPLRDHLRKILDGPVLWAPGVSGAVVLITARRRLPARVRPGSLDRLPGP